MDFPAMNSLYGIIMSRGQKRRKTEEYKEARGKLVTALQSIQPTGAGSPEDQAAEKAQLWGKVFQSTLPASKESLLADLMKLATMATKAPYDILDSFKDKYNNDTIIGYIYDDQNSAASITRATLGLPPARNDFAQQYEAARKQVRTALTTPFSGAVFPLAFKSFPYTYFDKNTAEALVSNNRLTHPEQVSDRVTETYQLIVDCTHKRTGLIQTVAIAMMHAYRREKYRKKDKWYNADSVEMTLLAFSVFAAEGMKIQNDQAAGPFFFFWKVFGSLFGLPTDRCHSTYQAARERMDHFDAHTEKIRRITPARDNETDARRKLLEAFLKADFTIAEIPFGLGEKLLTDPGNGELLSPHMRFYLTGT
jgi:hypothetical protein